MNYFKIYNSIIDRAIERSSLNPIIDYKESHHITPRCMGGTDCADNLVDLYPEEHYLCHLLLVKMYPKNYKLVIAATMMCVESNLHKRSNKVYGWLKRRRSTIINQTCKVCNNVFPIWKSAIKGNQGLCCSISCANTLRPKKHKTVSCECKMCGKVIYTVPSKPRSFCSRSCSNKHQVTV